MSEADSKRAFYRQGSWLVIATFISGLLMFAVHIFGAWMSRGEYGLFVTLLQILNLMMIPALGLQTVFAQQTAAAIEPQQQHDLAKSTRKMLLICLYIWTAIAVIVLLNQEAILESLKIERPTALYVTLLLGLPQLWLPVLLGILQGRQNFCVAWRRGDRQRRGTICRRRHHRRVARRPGGGSDDRCFDRPHHGLPARRLARSANVAWPSGSRSGQLRRQSLAGAYRAAHAGHGRRTIHAECRHDRGAGHPA